MAKGHRVGYVRVSAEDQNTERQLDGLELDRVFTDKASGKPRTGKRSLRLPRCLQLCNGNATTGSNCSSRSTNNYWKQWSDSRRKAKTIW